MTSLDNLVEPLKSYCDARSPHWSKETRRSVLYTLVAFHRWLDRNQLRLENLTREDIFLHVARPRRRPAAPAYQAINLAAIRRYFDWLRQNGHSVIEATLLWPSSTPEMCRVTDRLPQTVRDYCDQKATRWHQKTVVGTKYLLTAFHDWLKTNDVHLERLTRTDVERWVSRAKGGRRKAASQRICIRHIRRYLAWLHWEGHSRLDPLILWPKTYFLVRRRPPSPIVKRFLKDRRFSWKASSKAKYQSVVCHFCEFMENKGIPLKKVSITHAREFEAYLVQRNYQSRYRYKANNCLRFFLQWLKDAENIPVEGIETLLDLKPPCDSYESRLPLCAKNFLIVTGTNAKAKTHSNYKSAICHLHRFLDERSIDVKNVDRPDIEEWLKYLKDIRISPSWRRSIIFKSRVYLRWLKERRQLRRDPEYLLRLADLPRLPIYLPKPLPAELDAIIYKRLRESSDAYPIALMMMRLTGIRLGELLALPYDCVQKDHGGHHLLKVPLGKLDSERLVPLNDEGVAAIERLREHARMICRKGRRLRNPEFLLYSAKGGRPPPLVIRIALHDICAGLNPPDPITIHRFRHTYATALLNGGMSLVSVMKLLGHRSLRMTLHYAAVAPETIRDEYFAALAKLDSRYQLRKLSGATKDDSDPLESLADVIAWVTNATTDKGHQRKTQLLIKRLRRIKDEIATITAPE